MFLVDQLRSDYFGNLSKVENVVGYLFVIDQCQFLLHICILVGVMFRLLRDKILYFFGISTVVFRVSNSGGVFRLVWNLEYVSLEISLELIEIYKLYDLDLTFV